MIAKYGSKITITIGYQFRWTTGGISDVFISRVGLSEYSNRTGEWSSQ